MFDAILSAMYLTRHQVPAGPRWAADGKFLPPDFSLSRLLDLPGTAIADRLRALLAEGALLDPLHEVWGAGVPHLRSREARQTESQAVHGGPSVCAPTAPGAFRSRN